MGYFPFMIDIEGRDCLIVGGGRVALRKIESLLLFGGVITVIAPHFDEKIISIAEGSNTSGCGNALIKLYKKNYENKDINGRFLVIAATDDEELNKQIAGECRRQNILVNAVDIKDACTFIFPAIIKKDELVVAVSTGGASPAAAAFLKEKLEDAIPDSFEKNLAVLGRNRELILRRVDDMSGRKQLFYEILEYAQQNKTELTDLLVEEFISRYAKTGI